MSQNAIIYARISDRDQSTYSIEAQVGACEQWCAQNGYAVALIYIEPGRSAETDARPQFQNALAAVLAGQADILLVHKFDRFARSVLDSRLWKTKLRQAGRDVISVSEPIEDSPAGVMMEQILEVFAEHYRLNLSVEIKKGQRQKARQGIWPGRCTPTGYHRNDAGEIILTDLGQQLGPAFAEFASGDWTLEAWADESWRRGYRGVSGGKIYASSWQRIFRNKFYMGVMSWGGDEFPGTHPTVTDEATWQAVQAVLDAFGGADRQTEKHFFLLKGLAYSTVHQRPLAANAIKNSKGKRFYYYRAKGKPEHNIPAQILEEQVNNLLTFIYLDEPALTPVPEGVKLALRASQCVGDVYDALETAEQQRDLLQLVFPPASIKVGDDGVIGEFDVMPGFALGRWAGWESNVPGGAYE